MPKTEITVNISDSVNTGIINITIPSPMEPEMDAKPTEKPPSVHRQWTANGLVGEGDLPEIRKMLELPEENYALKHAKMSPIPHFRSSFRRPIIAHWFLLAYALGGTLGIFVIYLWFPAWFQRAWAVFWTPWNITIMVIMSIIIVWTMRPMDLRVEYRE